MSAQTRVAGVSREPSRSPHEPGTEHADEIQFTSACSGTEFDVPGPCVRKTYVDDRELRIEDCAARCDCVCRKPLVHGVARSDASAASAQHLPVESASALV